MVEVRMERGGRVVFPGAFYHEAKSHRITRRVVERAFRTPKWIDAIVPERPQPAASEGMTAWVADSATASRDDPFSILVMTRDRNGERSVHEAWRVYHSDVDLSHARSAHDVFVAFLDRYGLDVQIAGVTRRLFTACRLPMAASGNAGMKVLSDVERRAVHAVEILRLIPERSEIDVTIAFAIDEKALRRDLARHAVSPKA